MHRMMPRTTAYARSHRAPIRERRGHLSAPGIEETLEIATGAPSIASRSTTRGRHRAAATSNGLRPTAKSSSPWLAAEGKETCVVAQSVWPCLWVRLRGTMLIK